MKEVAEIFEQQPIKEKHIQTICTGTLRPLKNQGCGECQTSCQSACKTSCTVGNQICVNENI